MGLKRQVLSGARWIGTSVAVTSVLQLLQLTYIARVLDARSVGAVAVITMVVGLADILTNVGLSNSLIQRKEITQDEISSLYWLNAALGASIALILFASGPALEAFFRIPDLAGLIALVAVAFAITPHGQIFRGLLEKNLMFAPAALADILWATSTLGFCIGLTAVGLGAAGVVAAMVLGFAVKTIVLAVGARRLFAVKAHFRFDETRRFLSFSVFQVLDAIVGFVGNNAGAIAVGRILSASDLGGYNVAYSYAVTTPAKLNPVVTRVMFPALSRIQDDRRRVAEHTMSLLAVTGLINVAPLVGLALLADDFVDLVLGSKWSWVAPTLQLLSVVGILRAFGNPMGVVLMALDRMKLGFVINVAKAAVTIAAVTVGAMVDGMRGTATALVGVSLLSLVVNYLLLRRLLGVTFLQYAAPHWLAVRLALPMVIVLAGMTLMGGGLEGSLAWFVAKVVVGGGTYLATLALTRSPLVADLRGLAVGVNKGGERHDHERSRELSV
ncbi:MOP flippase family protein [Micromonospora thermarum]|uniref:MOP flippase family protein n=1 Tax=Micromonospora thermarum TaxID=2720024 RepID=A0ABX0YZA0_9ACTN|nr:MOP flippase family protein [Micromonospora thermarum]NJP30806.1 MOP flippase family protein [Micromonospora thermarum]